MSVGNRHIPFSGKQLPRKKRAIQLRGTDGDAGKYYRCWNCEFINNVDVAQVGDGRGNSSMVLEYDGLAPGSFGTGDCVNLTLDNPHSIALMKSDFSGNPIPPVAPRYVVVTGGCRFCGCKNYR